MANLMKKDGGEELAQTREWDPWRAVRDLLHWDPFRQMAPMAAVSHATFAPTFDVTESKDAYVFKADVPGVKQEDLEITTSGNRISVSGKRDIEEERKGATIYTYERQYGSFSRTFTLPDGADIDHAKSVLEEGVLTLVVPKHAAAQSKRIEVKSGAAKS